MSGKRFRMQRFFYPGTKKGLIVPIDHGLTVGALTGLKSFSEIAEWIADPSITGVIAHKGMAEKLNERGLLEGKGLMIHINGMSALSSTVNNKVRLTQIESALRFGADALSFQINFDGMNDETNLMQMGEIVDEANAVGLPVLAMVYDKVQVDEKQAAMRILHLVRTAFELGCTAVKIAPPPNLTSTLSEMAKMIPVFLAGGSLMEEDELLSLTERAIVSGASGLCVGRNIFERNNPGLTLQLKNRIIQSTVTRSDFLKDIRVAAH
jgi:class I fructose-bisphosphate aldolase